MFCLSEKLHCTINILFLLSNFNDLWLSVSRVLYFEKDISTSANVIGTYLKYNISFAVKSSGSTKFFMSFSSPLALIYT